MEAILVIRDDGSSTVIDNCGTFQYETIDEGINHIKIIQEGEWELMGDYKEGNVFEEDCPEYWEEEEERRLKSNSIKEESEWIKKRESIF